MPRRKTADITPATYTYEWSNAEQTSLRRTDAESNVAFVPVAEGNRDYAEFLVSGQAAAEYVAPPESEPLTTEEKLNRLLADYGLTRDEMKSALAVKTPAKATKK